MADTAQPIDDVRVETTSEGGYQVIVGSRRFPVEERREYWTPALYTPARSLSEIVARLTHGEDSRHVVRVEQLSENHYQLRLDNEIYPIAMRTQYVTPALYMATHSLDELVRRLRNTNR